MDQNTINEILQELRQAGLVRRRADLYELRHDSLATKIHSKRSVEEKELLRLVELIQNANKKKMRLEKQDMRSVKKSYSRIVGYLPEENKAALQSFMDRQIRVQRAQERLKWAALLLVIILPSVVAFKSLQSQRDKYELTRDDRDLAYDENDHLKAYRLFKSGNHLLLRIPFLSSYGNDLESYDHKVYFPMVGDNIDITKNYIVAWNKDKRLINCLDLKSLNIWPMRAESYLGCSVDGRYLAYTSKDAINDSAVKLNIHLLGNPPDRQPDVDMELDGRSTIVFSYAPDSSVKTIYISRDNGIFEIQARTMEARRIEQFDNVLAGGRRLEISAIPSQGSEDADKPQADTANVRNIFNDSLFIKMTDGSHKSRQYVVDLKTFVVSAFKGVKGVKPKADPPLRVVRDSSSEYKLEWNLERKTLTAFFVKGKDDVAFYRYAGDDIENLLNLKATESGCFVVTRKKGSGPDTPKYYVHIITQRSKPEDFYAAAYLVPKYWEPRGGSVYAGNQYLLQFQRRSTLERSVLVLRHDMFDVFMDRSSASYTKRLMAVYTRQSAETHQRAREMANRIQ